MFGNFINLRAHPKRMNRQASSMPSSIRQYQLSLADKRLIFTSVDLSFFGLRPILLATPLVTNHTSLNKILSIRFVQGLQ